MSRTCACKCHKNTNEPCLNCGHFYLRNLRQELLEAIGQPNEKHSTGSFGDERSTRAINAERARTRAIINEKLGG